MPVPKNLMFFRENEFKHPELVDAEAAYFLDYVRGVYNNPLVVTDDARTPTEVTARENPLQGGSKTSLHGVGRAFDLRWPVDDTLVWRFVSAVALIERDTRYKSKVELELDHTPGNEHIHLGLRLDATRGTRLILRRV